MNLSKRNPLLRNKKTAGFNSSVGSLKEEIKRQDLEVIEGGSVEITLGAAALYTTTQSIATQIWKCGAVLTTSAECSRT
ncbi:plantaricin C family lantibiotic, partial [Bacillus cereus]|nr:plantaricin C family lantibiotic [Bacillus cereus]